MNFIHLFALLGLAALRVAAGLQSQYYRVLEMNLFSPSGRPGQVNNYTVDFTVWDHNKATNASTTCHASWHLGTQDWPKEDVPCKDPQFSFHFKRLTSYNNFTLFVSHSYKDKSVGPPGMDTITTFAKKRIVPDDFHCVHAASGFSECQLLSVVQLPVYAAIA